MSNPDNVTAEAKATDSAPEQTIEQQVNDYAKALQKGEELPADLPEALRFAAMAEKRRRDTFSSYTKAQQELKASQAKLAKLEERVPVSIPEGKQAELDDLKHTDPDRWRVEMNKLEAAARAELDKEATQVSELESRRQALEQFIEEHPSFELSDDIIANDVPPRYTKQLEQGKISFGEFLEQVHSYLTGSKVIAQPDEVLKQPSFSKAGGATAPTNQAMASDIVSSYANELY